MTYLWKEEYGQKHYKIQTDEKAIADILKRRKNFTLVTYGLNCDLWIFNCEFKRPDIARKVLKSITGKNGKTDCEGVIFYE